MSIAFPSLSVSMNTPENHRFRFPLRGRLLRRGALLLLLSASLTGCVTRPPTDPPSVGVELDTFDQAYHLATQCDMTPMSQRPFPLNARCRMLAKTIVLRCTSLPLAVRQSEGVQRVCDANIVEMQAGNSN